MQHVEMNRGRTITDLIDMVERIQEHRYLHISEIGTIDPHSDLSPVPQNIFSGVFSIALPRCERTFVRSDNQSWQCSRTAKVGAYREELTVCMECFWEAFA